MATKAITESKSLGCSARKVRLALGITQQELAEITGLTREAVHCFEHDMPVFLDARRRILKVLWAIKTARQSN